MKQPENSAALKVHRGFRLLPEVNRTLRAMAEKTNITQTRLVELAIIDLAVKHDITVG